MDIVSKELDEIKFIEDVLPRLPEDFNENIKALLTREKVSGISILLPARMFKKNTANTVSDLNILAKYIYDATRQKAKLHKGDIDQSRTLDNIRYRFVEVLNTRTGDPMSKLNIIGEYTSLIMEKPNLWKSLINKVNQWMSLRNK